MRTFVGTHHILMMTLDTLRFDVAERAWAEGRLPNFAKCFPGGWQRRHTPANFTFAAHQAFFAGYLPTPICLEKPTRLFAASFEGSETIGPETFVFPQANLPEALAARGYDTHCIGGVGFFNRRNALGQVLPSYFERSYWNESLGVTCRESAENQFALANNIIVGRQQRPLFIFINISAIHQPNCSYLEGAGDDSPASQQAALEYVDRSFAKLLAAMQTSGPWFGMIFSDHGTAYGEEGRSGHRWNHPSIGDVPYADFELAEALKE